ncbi:mediator of RNA polymerase II transcription subunit 9 isoform 1-T1 [Phoenicopterus ruber ruber]
MCRVNLLTFKDMCSFLLFGSGESFPKQALLIFPTLYSQMASPLRSQRVAPATQQQVTSETEIFFSSMDKDSQDVHQVLNELKNKFQEMRKLISSMPGIGVSPEQQQQQLQNLREQVRTKNELLQKYKSLCMFEIPKE